MNIDELIEKQRQRNAERGWCVLIIAFLFVSVCGIGALFGYFKIMARFRLFHEEVQRELDDKAQAKQREEDRVAHFWETEEGQRRAAWLDRPLLSPQARDLYKEILVESYGDRPLHPSDDDPVVAQLLERYPVIKWSDDNNAMPFKCQPAGGECYPTKPKDGDAVIVAGCHSQVVKRHGRTLSTYWDDGIPIQFQAAAGDNVTMSYIQGYKDNRFFGGGNYQMTLCRYHVLPSNKDDKNVVLDQCIAPSRVTAPIVDTIAKTTQQLTYRDVWYLLHQHQETQYRQPIIDWPFSKLGDDNVAPEHKAKGADFYTYAVWTVIAQQDRKCNIQHLNNCPDIGDDDITDYFQPLFNDNGIPDPFGDNNLTDINVKRQGEWYEE